MTDHKHHQHPADPVPDPEPASPSLPGPDRGVFGHDIKAEETKAAPGKFKPRDDWEPGGPPGGKNTGGGGGNNSGGSNTGGN